MTTRLAVGTPVTVDKPYGGHPQHPDTLVVLDAFPSEGDGLGYGIGPAGNDPDKAHDARWGWLYYPELRVHPKTTHTGENTVTTIISYEDIREGDTIKRTRTYLSGATDTREGVAAHEGDYYWADKDDAFILAYSGDSHNEDTTLELVNRPEPEPAKPWENAVPGTVLLRHDGEKSPESAKPDHVYKLANGDWLLTYGGATDKSFTFKDENACVYLSDYKITAAV